MTATAKPNDAGMAVVIGLGVTGQALTRHLVSQGHRVVIVEDHPTADSAAKAEEAGATLASPATEELRTLLADAALVAPNPGVKPDHAVFALARELGVPVAGEIELAYRIAPMPLVAVTGTNGKTTVTTLAAAMLNASGKRAVAAGNIGYPLIEAVAQDLDVVVAEVSSFQLASTEQFRPSVAVWLNIDENHLDWHPDMQHYAECKARIWGNQAGDDVAVVNAADPVVMDAAHRAPARVVTFGGDGGYTVDDGWIVTPGRERIIEVGTLPRRLPHDVSNAAAACAAAMEAGAQAEGCASALMEFTGLPHRLEPIGEADGVRWFNDSNATTPTSVLAALRSFPSVVLIAGGKNKGTDLGVLRAESARIRSVVAIGDAAPDVKAAFDGATPVVVAGSMDDAVVAAQRAAKSGDAVLLSPGCASFDWYRSYGERGDDFRRAVRDLVLENQ